DVADQRLQLREGVGSDVEAAEATWAYNQNGQVTTVIDGNGNRAALRYDGHGRQDRWTFPSATPLSGYNDATHTTALDTAGAVNPADYEEYTYDPNGNRTNLRKRDERNIAFAYDDLNRVTAKTYPQGGATAVHYGYDLRNLQLSARFGSTTGEGLTNVYDGFGRLASSSIDMGGTAHTLGNAYNRNGNRVRLTHPDGAFFSTDYDGLNRPTWMTDPLGGGITLSAYDTMGAPVSLGRPGAATGYWVTGDGRLISLSHYLAPGLEMLWGFAHNPAGQIASATRTNPGSGPRQADAYAWTGAYNAARPYAANGLNQYSRTGQPNTAGSVAFIYDSNGNPAPEAPAFSVAPNDPSFVFGFPAV
ncbi:MAG TPA: hypothetical protein VEX35_12230, partial [Allosphingosinicella sp.]|nr:hypothetical protein [Allosphingosinicella sp.]